MARIEWVKDKLDNWARWHAERSSGALGYPRASSFARFAGRTGRVESVIPIDSVEASVTEDGVQALRWSRPHLYLTLVHIYVDGWDIKRTAAKLSKAESTIKAHLEQADASLAAWFRERSDRQAEMKDSGSFKP